MALNGILILGMMLTSLKLQSYMNAIAHITRVGPGNFHNNVLEGVMTQDYGGKASD